MGTGFFLLDNPNRHGEHFYRTRRGPLLAVVLHITAGLEDLDGVADHSAEQTARYAATTDRAVSWHSGSDTDSALDLLPWSMTAFHVQGYNSTTAGHEISKTSPDWRGMPAKWVEATLRRAADHLRPKMAAAGIPFRYATKAELDREIAKGAAGRPVGLLYHWQLDDDRRQDPGQVGSIDTFPRSRFLELLTGPTGGETMHRPDDVVAVLTTPDGKGRWHLTFDGGIRTSGTAKFLGSIPGLREDQRAGFRGAEILLPFSGGYEIVDLKGNSYHFPAP